MIEIIRVVRFDQKPWQATPVGHCGDDIKLAIRSDEKPHPVTVDGITGGFELRPKTWAGAQWWTGTIDAPWWVGAVSFSIVIGAAHHRWSTEVLPASGVFPDTRAAVQRLLTRLIQSHAYLPWGATGATRAGDLHDDHPDGPTPPKLHIAALDAWLPRLLTALGRIERRPLHALAATRARRPVERVTRVDDRTLVALGRQPALVAALRGAPSSGGRRRLNVPTVQSSVHHPANQALLWGVRRLERRTAGAAQAFVDYREGLKGQKGSVARRAEADRQIAHLGACAARLSEAMRRRPWRDLTPARPTPTAEQVFADAPVYGEAMRTIRRLLRPVVTPRVEGLVDAHLRKIFDLWEQYVWCRVVRIVRDGLGAGWQWTPPPFGRTGLGVGPAPDTFAEARRGDVVVRVGNQTEFDPGRLHHAAHGDWRADRFSLHGRRKPDVTVEIEASGISRWFVLDAKFTAKRFPIESSHLPVTHHYRDGLRLHGRRPDGVFLVLPALDDEARCYGEAAYHDAFEVGVIVDRGLTRLPGEDAPGVDYRPLTRWLDTALGEVSIGA